MIPPPAPASPTPPVGRLRRGEGLYFPLPTSHRRWRSQRLDPEHHFAQVHRAGRKTFEIKS